MSANISSKSFTFILNFKPSPPQPIELIAALILISLGLIGIVSFGKKEN